MKSVAKKEDAVSPVIGTILLVAITVVLVAIVAAVVMGMVGGIGQSKDVGIVITPYANTSGSYDVGYTLTMMSGKDTTSLNKVDSYLIPDDNDMIIHQSKSDGNKLYKEIKDAAIGKTYYIKMNDAAGMSGQLIITGTFTDGTQAVIYQGTITIPNKVN